MKIIISEEYEQDRRKITNRIEKEGYGDRAIKITNGFNLSSDKVISHPTAYSLVQTFRNKKKYWRISRYKSWNIFFIYNKLKNEYLQGSYISTVVPLPSTKRPNALEIA